MMIHFAWMSVFWKHEARIHLTRSQAELKAPKLEDGFQRALDFQFVIFLYSPVRIPIPHFYIPIFLFNFSLLSYSYISTFPTFLFLYFYIGPANIRWNLLLPLRLQLLHLFSLFSKFAPPTLERSISCKFYRLQEMRSSPSFKFEPTCVNQAVKNSFLAYRPF